MANFDDCVSELLNAGRITGDEADRLRQTRDQAANAFRLTGLSDVDAQTQAGASALRTRHADVAQRRRQIALQMRAQGAREVEGQSHPRGRVAGLMAQLRPDADRLVGIESVESRAGGLINFAHSKLAEFMAAARTKLGETVLESFGLRRANDLVRRVALERFGGATGDAQARAFSDAVGETFELMRTLFNRAGGSIPKLEGYGLPTAHDARLVSRIDKSAWIERVMQPGVLDRRRMVDANLSPYDDATLRAVLEGVYDKIVTEGASDLVPGATGGRKLANTRQDHRFLHFANGDEWLRYHDEFGPSDLYASIMGHIEGMAREVALMEKFGPNPDASFRYLRDLATQDGSLKGGPTASMLDSTWNVVSGKAGGTANVAVSEFMQSARNFLTATRLGSAVLSAVTDIAFVRQAAAWNGLKTTRFVNEFVSQLMTLPAGQRKIQAVKLGIGADGWVTKGLAANRFSEVTGLGKTAAWADTTMRLSGLSKWTDAELTAWGRMALGELGDHVAGPLSAMPPDLVNALKRFGINDDAWNDIRGAGTLDLGDGVKYVNIEQIMLNDTLQPARRLELARALTSFIYETGRIAVPHPNAEVRAITTAGRQSGTAVGEITRAVAQFKSFPLTILMMQLRRGFYEAGGANKAKYLSGLIVGTTAMGALALQLKEISKGRDPRDMADPKFWGSAFTQGGGAGLYGDFIYSGITGTGRHGNSMLETAAGPMVGFVGDVADLTIGNAGQAMTGDDPKFVGEAIRFAGRNVPYLSSTWYTRLAFERMVVDQLRLEADPSSRRQMATNMRKRQNEYGQEYFWKPGAPLPQRAPELEAAIGE